MRFLWAPLALLSATVFSQQTDNRVLAPYVPSPPAIADKMLQLAKLKHGEKFFDLGSGDGRIVILAAKKYRANAVGVEIDQKLCEASQERIRQEHLESRAKIICGDILDQDYSSADVIAVYLFPEANEKVRPMLERQLKPGTRVVAHDFEFQAWKPAATEVIEDDGSGRSRMLFLYIR